MKNRPILTGGQSPADRILAAYVSGAGTRRRNLDTTSLGEVISKTLADLAPDARAMGNALGRAALARRSLAVPADPPAEAIIEPETIETPETSEAHPSAPKVKRVYRRKAKVEEVAVEEAAAARLPEALETVEPEIEPEPVVMMVEPEAVPQIDAGSAEPARTKRKRPPRPRHQRGKNNNASLQATQTEVEAV